MHSHHFQVVCKSKMVAGLLDHWSSNLLKVVSQTAAIAHDSVKPISALAVKLQRAVGDHIQTLPARQGESERKLWAFVSSFTENKMDGDKLSKLYAKLKANKAAPSGEPWNRWDMKL